MTRSAEYRRILTRMGYYNYQSGLIYRHLNQEGRWDSHLEMCRNFILKAIDHYSPSKVTVLGSGWLMELPVAEILERGIKICLVDIVHPPEVITQTGAIKNVELIEDDVTGGLINEVWFKSSKYSFLKKLKYIDDIVIPEYNMPYDPGMIVSLNILTQLESLLVDFLKKRSDVKENDFFRFRKEIQKKHIDFLIKNKSVLISDLAEIITDKSGNIHTVPTMLTEVPEGILKEEWIWNYDMKSTDFNNITSVMKVLAITI